MFKALTTLLFAMLAAQASAASWHVTTVSSGMQVAQLKATTGTGKPLTLAFTEDGGRRVAMLTGPMVFDCPQTCTVSVQVDGGKIEYWDAVRSTPGNYSIVTLAQGERFYRRINGAQQIVVEDDVYGFGSARYSFDVPFDVPPLPF